MATKKAAKKKVAKKAVRKSAAPKSYCCKAKIDFTKDINDVNRCTKCKKAL